MTPDRQGQCFESLHSLQELRFVRRLLASVPVLERVEQRLAVLMSA